MSGALDWLPPDTSRGAACSWTDAKGWALTLGPVVTVVVSGPLVGAPAPLPAVGAAIAVVAALFSVRVVRARVTVGADGIDHRGIAASRRVAWSEVASIDVTSGPFWLAVVSGRPFRASARLTQRSTTSTVIRLRDGTTLRPLALTRGFPSRRADQVTSLARQLLSEQHG